MLPTNLITVLSCPSLQQKCPICSFLLTPGQPCVRTEQLTHVHLACYQPKYPVSITPKTDAFLALHSSEEASIWEAWLSNWNEKFRPISEEVICAFSLQRLKGKGRDSRLLIEVFKFLPASEVCQGLSQTCRLWYDVAWSPELWTNFGSRDFPHGKPPFPISTRIDYIRAFTQSCLICHNLPSLDGIKALCPNSRRPICSACFQLPENTLFQAREYATLLNVSEDYIKEAQIPMHFYNGRVWVYAHQADPRVTVFRQKRRAELIQILDRVDHSFSNEDLETVKSLNMSKARYLGAMLKGGLKGSKDLTKLLKFIFSSTESQRLSFSQSLKRRLKPSLK